jgi:hypothetical protein
MTHIAPRHARTPLALFAEEDVRALLSEITLDKRAPASAREVKRSWAARSLGVRPSGAVDAKLFRQIHFEAAVEARQRVALLDPQGAAPDHPVAITHPQGEYLKGWLATGSYHYSRQNYLRCSTCSPRLGIGRRDSSGPCSNSRRRLPRSGVLPARGGFPD